jgi:hypothetical protein
VNDGLRMYWKLKAKHALCGVRLLRDLAKVAAVATQAAWATRFAALLVGDTVPQAGAASSPLGPSLQRGFAARYGALVTQGLAANPDPRTGRERDYYRAGRVLQLGDRLRQAPRAHLEVHARPPDPHDQQLGRARPQAHEVTYEDQPAVPAASTVPSASPTYAATSRPHPRTACQRSPLLSTWLTSGLGCRPRPSRSEHLPRDGCRSRSALPSRSVSTTVVVGEPSPAYANIGHAHLVTIGG